MKRIFIICLSAISMAALVFGQEPKNQRQSPASSQGTSQQLSPAQSAEIAEANRLSDSASEFLSKRDYDQALLLARRALDIGEKEVGAESPLIVNYLNKIAVIYLARRQFEEAEASFKRALDVREKALGAEHLDAAQSLYNLAEFYRIKGDYNKALPLYERVVKIREKAQGSEVVDVVVARFRYACILRKNDRPKEALEVEGNTKINDSKRLPQSSTAQNNGGESSTGGGIRNGKAMTVPQPAYPESARSAGATGKVVVQVLIDETGKVLNACAVNGHPSLWQASEQAAYQARFTPTTLSGQPVKTLGVLTYSFSK